MFYTLPSRAVLHILALSCLLNQAYAYNMESSPKVHIFNDKKGYDTLQTKLANKTPVSIGGSMPSVMQYIKFYGLMKEFSEKFNTTKIAKNQTQQFPENTPKFIKQEIRSHFKEGRFNTETLPEIESINSIKYFLTYGLNQNEFERNIKTLLADKSPCLINPFLPSHFLKLGSEEYKDINVEELVKNFMEASANHYQKTYENVIKQNPEKEIIILVPEIQYIMAALKAKKDPITTIIDCYKTYLGLGSKTTQAEFLLLNHDTEDQSKDVENQLEFLKNITFRKLVLFDLKGTKTGNFHPSALPSHSSQGVANQFIFDSKPARTALIKLITSLPCED